MIFVSNQTEFLMNDHKNGKSILGLGKGYYVSMGFVCQMKIT